MRVLLAEDNATNVELFLAALENDGHEVTVEKDGVAARERAMRQAFDLIVLDIQMPLLDGYTLCAELRAWGIRGPIIALSAAALPSDIERGTEFGFNAYLTKPLRPAELRAAVRRFQPDADRSGSS
jgi:CheY-like chemotaxis protein